MTTVAPEISGENSGERKQKDDKVVEKFFSSSLVKKGIDNDQVVNTYADVSTKYNELFCAGRYNAPEIAASVLLELYSPNERKNTKMIDMAAGTGRLGILLKHEGFKSMDGLEPCQELLDEMIQTGIYEKAFNNYIGVGKLSAPDRHYDLTVCVGSFCEGHIPVCGVDELIQVTKPGGQVVIVMRNEFLWTVEAYKDKLEPHMDKLEVEGKWKKVEKRIVPDYFVGLDGVVFIYRVL